MYTDVYTVNILNSVILTTALYPELEHTMRLNYRNSSSLSSNGLSSI